jgi:hypothetical protein
MSLPSKPKAIIEELHVHRGNAIADVVAIHKEAHCYEIKGETDSIKRLEAQGKYYDLVFKKVTLVTTENHKNNALKYAPAHWGIIIISLKGEKGIVRFLRKSKFNPNFNKQSALLTLWKEEMLTLSSKFNITTTKKSNRNTIIENISKEVSSSNISLEIANSLALRKNANDAPT